MNLFAMQMHCNLLRIFSVESLEQSSAEFLLGSASEQARYAFQRTGVYGCTQLYKEIHQDNLKQCTSMKHDLVTQLMQLDDRHEQAHDKNLKAKTKFEFKQELKQQKTRCIRHLTNNSSVCILCADKSAVPSTALLQLHPSR